MLKILILTQDQTSPLLTSYHELMGDYAVTISSEFSGLAQTLANIQPKTLVCHFTTAMNEAESLKISKMRSIYPKMPILVVAAPELIEAYSVSLKELGVHFLSTPFESRALKNTIHQLIQATEMVETAAYLSPVLKAEEGLSSQSDEMNEIYRLIGKVASVNTPILLRGESGTGKEVMAKAIHFNGSRKNGKFVAINCSAIPETLIESELFGHEKGSFTGAVSKKIGKFEYAHGGTLFLDEIGDVSAPMQVKLLRVLQEKKFTPVGSNVEMFSDVRIIAATNRDLEDMMKKNLFREDLFYRLSVLPIFLPPLRDRKEDIRSLVGHFIRSFNEIHVHKSIHGIDKDALEMILEYPWPGNIRELRNVIEHAFVLESTSVITPKSLPERLIVGQNFANAEVLVSAKTTNESLAGDLDFQVEKERFERDFLVRALKKYKGKINQTSLQTKIPKKTLLRKIEKYKINTSEFKD